MRMRFFLIGGVESLPIWLAIGLGKHLEPSVPHAATNVLGVILAIAVCWLLRKSVPPSVVHLCGTNQEAAKDLRLAGEF